MPKYHVNTAGEVAVCRARTNPCPFESALHSEDKAVAEALASEYIENRVEMESFPRNWDSNFVEKQAAIHWVNDNHLGSGNNPHRDWQYDGADERRFKDYLDGYKEAIGRTAEDEAEIEREASASKKQQPGIDGVFDPTAFKLGYARSLRVQREPARDGSLWARRKIEDYNLDAYKGADGKYDDVRFVQNPFKGNQRVLLATGDEYTEYEKGKAVRKVIDKPVWVKVDSVQRPYVSGAVGRVIFTPSSITYFTGPNSSAREVVLTPEILSANGHETFEASLVNSDLYLTPIYDDIRQWEKLPKSWTGTRTS